MADTKEQIQYDKDLAKLNSTPSGYARTQLKKAFDAKYPDGRPATPAPELTQEEKDAAAAKAAEDKAAADAAKAAEAAAAETKRKNEAAAAALAAKGVTYKFKYPRILPAAEVQALSPEERVIYETEVSYKNNTGYRDDPTGAKLNADNAIRDKAKAEGRNLTQEEFDKLNVKTIQDRLFGLQGFKPGTPQNPFLTGKAAEKRPYNTEAMTFSFYQQYLAGHNEKINLPMRPPLEPMSLEEFTRVYESLGGQGELIDRNQNRGIPGVYSEFSKGQGELAIRTRGRAIPGMDLMLDPRANATADDVINAYMSQNPDDPMNLFSDIYAGGYGADGGYGTATGGGTGGQYTTMGTSTGSSANIKNPYKVGTQQYEDFKDRRSAYDLLFTEFSSYGLGSLVEPLKNLILQNVPKSEFVIRLRQTEPYKKRFAGNAARVAKGLAALDESSYIQLEDAYQNIMRNYGLPESYWAKDSIGTQEGFTNFIGNDVSAPELESRIMNAQKRVINANPEVSTALKQFYPEITDGDILAYTLDPTKGLDVINRKITAAEIGGAALAQGLQTGATRAEELASYGVTKDQAMQNYEKVAQVLPRGGQLASMYGESPYDQTTAEQEFFGLGGSAAAAARRKKLVGLEVASFSGQSGLTQGALGRERAGGF